MPNLVTREDSPSRGYDLGVGPPMRWGLVSPAAVQLGLGQVARFPQGDRLAVSAQRQLGDDPSPWGVERLMDPRTLDAGRILDFGAPAISRVVEFAPFAFRPTEAPVMLQRSVALGGRYVEFR